MTDSLGEEFTKLYNQSEREANECDGGVKYLKEAASAVAENLHSHIDKDLKEGTVFPSTQEETLSYVKKYITRASDSMRTLADRIQLDGMVARGKMRAYENAVSRVGVLHKNNLAAASFQLALEKRKEEVLNGSGGDTPEEKAFLERLRESEDPMEVSGSGPDGRHTKEERKLVTLEKERRGKDGSSDNDSEIERVFEEVEEEISEERV